MIRELRPRTVEPSEAELYAGLRRGESEAFDLLYRHARPMAIRVLTDKGCPATDAEDLFQDGLMSLWQNIQDGKYERREGVKVSTYLVQLCRNRWIDRTRRVAYRQTDTVAEHSPGLAAEVSDDHLLREARHEQLDRAFAQLGERCREMLKRFYFKRDPLSLLAEEMGITPQTAKNEKYRCTQRLRKLCAA